MIKQHALRDFDAIHLASALILKLETEEDLVFLASDQRLLKAAIAQQLTTLNPEEEAIK